MINLPKQYVRRDYIMYMIHFESSLLYYIHSIVGYDNYGIKLIDKLIMDYYLCSKKDKESKDFTHTMNSEAVLWRMDTKGTPLNASVIKYDKQGRVQSCYPFSQVLTYEWYTYEPAFFGGHLLSKYKDKEGIIVQDELTALLAALAYPQFSWLAVGAHQNLTRELLSTVRYYQIRLIPDTSVASEYWSKLALDVKGVKILKSDIFLDQDINGYFIKKIKENMRDIKGNYR